MNRGPIGAVIMRVLVADKFEKSGLEGLKDLQKRHKVVGDVDGLGLALRMEICERDGFTPNRALATCNQ